MLNCLLTIAANFSISVLHCRARSGLHRIPQSLGYDANSTSVVRVLLHHVDTVGAGQSGMVPSLTVGCTQFN